ncbi:molybdopterin-dependent oxidoreductase [Paenibacillus contaminans]|uniref:Oxidoreductase n=1 Tax=Paenibacillus contaminans TaxID=450362 RepID=A0A329M4P2_9BACL|nr:molybdopterin-dependent oxidoreductase [Paenibacillus contaminans]RAV14844.1 oxidoreductase [Paenibacillus contaminans]
MERFREWLKQPYGQKLKALHAWNGWLVLVLAVTGIMIYIPSIRGELGALRVLLKQLHIVLGIGSIAVVAMYLPLIAKHLRQLKGKTAQIGNLWVVLLLLAGWSVSGIILWQFRSLPPAWSNTALVIHDLFTWIGIPYAAYHSISRSRYLKRIEREEKRAEAAKRRSEERRLPGPISAADSGERYPVDYSKLDRPFLSRRMFIRLGAAAALLVVIGPSFYRWMKGAFNTGGGSIADYSSGDGNKMLPPPEPLAESAVPAGGGAKGQFRIYTVTEFPVYTTENWSFSINGLVDKPQTWDWEAFQAIPRKVQVSDFHCVTGWSVRSCTWEGIPLSQFLDAAGLQAKAKFVKLYSGDGVYTDCLSLEQARMEDVMVAVLLDGQLIPQKLGGPVRLVVPKMYAYKSVKWLNRIELIEKEHFGYWEVRGYDQDAWV